MKICRLLFLLVIAGCAPEQQMKQAVAGWSRTGVVAYCVSKEGRKVGDGQCWALADEAMKSAGKSRPGSDMRVWGRVVNPARESIQAGDILEFESAEFREEKMTIVTGRHHTAVVIIGGSAKKFTVAEQNFGGAKRVRFREMGLDTLVSGKVTVYRPE
jgi:hypothetical protein